METTENLVWDYYSYSRKNFAIIVATTEDFHRLKNDFLYEKGKSQFTTGGMGQIL